MFNSVHHLQPATQQSACAVQVQLEQLPAQCWQLTYRLHDPQQQMIWPNVQPVLQRQDGLWQSTCFELFIQAVGQTGYLELNFSPSRQWNAYQFDAYRQPAQMPPRRDDSLRLNSLSLSNHKLVAVVDLSDCFQAGQALSLGISAVLQDQAGQCSYWALQHGGEPDFHRASDWLIQVDA